MVTDSQGFDSTSSSQKAHKTKNSYRGLEMVPALTEIKRDQVDTLEKAFMLY